MNNGASSLLPRLAAGVLALTLLAGCGGGDEKKGADPKKSGAATSSAAATEEPYLDVPSGIELTTDGTRLDLGAKAVVAWQPRQKEVAVLELAVQRVERTSFDASFGGWKIDDKTAAMTPYFVRVTATNPTTVDLGGVAVPAYLADDAETLVEASTFKGNFPACSGGVLPKKFGQGASAELCLVYFVSQGREFTNVTFQLPGDLEPITWAGKVEKKVQPPKAPKQKP